MKQPSIPHLLSRRSLCALVGSLTFAIALGVPGGAAAADDGPFIVLIGAPGSGKTTQGTYLSERHGVPLISMTDVLEEKIRKASRPTGSRARRQAYNSRAENARRALDRLEDGEMITDTSLDALAAARLSGDDAKNGFILDGYPGSAASASFLDAFTDGRGIETLHVIYLDVSDEVAISRMKERGRADDRRGFGEERLRQFRTNIDEVLEFYEGEHLHTIDASKSLSAIRSELDSALAQ
jgi:adenylate kinase